MNVSAAATAWLIFCIAAEIGLRLMGGANYNGKVTGIKQGSDTGVDFFGKAKTEYYTIYYIDINGDGNWDESQETSGQPTLNPGDSVRVSMPFLAGPFRSEFTKIEKVK